MNEYPLGKTTAQNATHIQDLAMLSDEAFWEYARELAHCDDKTVQAEEYLECYLCDRIRLLALKALYEVVLPLHAIAMLPVMPSWMPGVVAWRDEVMPVIDLGAYLLAQPIEFVQEGTLLVAYAESVSGDVPLGLLVSGVGKIRRGPSKEEGMVESEVELREVWDKSLIVDVPLLLADALRHIGTGMVYG